MTIIIEIYLKTKIYSKSRGRHMQKLEQKEVILNSYPEHLRIVKKTSDEKIHMMIDSVEAEKVIDDLPLSLPIKWDDPFWVILMGIEHERIHLETSSVLIRQLPLDLVTPGDAWPLCPDSDPSGCF